MKLRFLSAAVALAASTVTWAANGTAPQAAAQAPAQPIPQTPEAWMNRMSDMTQNMSAYKDPKVFVPWANAVTEPGFYSTMGTMMMDPAGWTRMMGTAMDPNAFRNAAAFADPNVYMKWMAAGMDPSFYTAMLTQLSDPNKMMRWMMMPMDPKMWNLMMQGMNPNMYMKWMMMPMDPKVWQMGMNTMNPNLYMAWLGAGMDPKTYGSWGAWLTQPGQPAGAAPSYAWPAPAAPAAGTAAPAFFNPFDPNMWNQMMAAPLAAVAPAPAPAKAAPSAAVAAPAKPAAAPAPAKAAPAAAAPVAAAAPAAAPAAPAAPTSKTVLAGDALFKLGKSGIKDLTGEGKKSLDALAEQIKQMGEVDQIKIVGHADASGKVEPNQKLSEARARSVKSYLVAKGVKSSVIVTSGAGSSQPVVQCDMKLPSKELADCLAPNRRVEVEIVGKAK